MVQVGHEAGRLLLDDVDRRRQLLVALAAILLTGGLQVVDRIQIHAQPIADRRLEIARHAPGRE